MGRTAMSALNCDLALKTTLPWLNNSPSPPIFGRQPSFPDVFGAADDPDFSFGELTKSGLAIEEAFLENDEQAVSTCGVTLSLRFSSKSLSLSSGNESVLGSDGNASSSDENDVTIMDFINESFQMSL